MHGEWDRIGVGSEPVGGEIMLTSMYVNVQLFSAYKVT